MKKEYTPFELEINTFGYYVNRAFCSMIKLLNRELKENNIDLQHAEFSIIKILEVIEGATQTQLATILGKERSGVSRTLNSLESKSYINRKALNGSTNFITLTEKGKGILPTLAAIAQNVTAKATKGIPEKSKQTMINNLIKIYKNSLS